MLAIRLKRVGRTNDPSFRVVVQDHRRSPKKSRGVVEYVGFYDARKGQPQINADRIKYWLTQGAKPSDTVHNLLVDTKVISGKKVNAMNKKTSVKKEISVQEEKKPAPVVEAEKEAPAFSKEKAEEIKETEVAEEGA